jgi:hypothetical protein
MRQEVRHYAIEAVPAHEKVKPGVGSLIERDAPFAFVAQHAVMEGGAAGAKIDPRASAAFSMHDEMVVECGADAILTNQSLV